MKSSLVSLIALSSLFAASTVHAEGLLGKRYVEAEYNFSSYENVDLSGFGVAVNIPLSIDDETFNYDLVANLSSVQDDENWMDYERVAASGGLRFFTTENDFNGITFNPYTEFLVGFADVDNGGSSDSSFTFSIGVGAEFIVSEAMTVRPYFNYSDATSFEDGGVEAFGIEANLWLNDSNNIGVYAEGESRDDKHVDVFGINYRFAF